MIIDQQALDELTARAKDSPRLRMNLDLRNSPADQSQRMLNAIEPGTVLPIHRHRTSSETVVCIRGHFEEYFYDVSGVRTAVVDMVPGGNVLNIPAGCWHSLRSLENGTVLMECKDGPWEELELKDVLYLDKLEEISIEKIPFDYKQYVKDSIGIPQVVSGQQLWYCRIACHVNSILFSNLINSQSDLIHSSIIEGIVICEDGLAYEHMWNLIQTNTNDIEYVDVTMDAIASDIERRTGKKYYKLFEYSQDDLIRKISRKESLFSKEVLSAIQSYYMVHPDMEEVYRKGKQTIDSI